MTREPRSDSTPADPHGDRPISTAGAPPQAAQAAVILLHGRGSNARSMLTLIDEFLHHGVMYLAPEAAHSSWYPRSATAPVEENEPWLSSAVEHVSTAIATAASAGVPADRTLLLGFSQGGCLASEFVVRTPRRYGGLVVLSGSLPGEETTRGSEGSIEGTPVFLGYGADDPAVTPEQVRRTVRVFERLGGRVDSSRYEGLGHEINDDEIRRIDTLVEQLVPSGSG
ncbi:alpha/beta hydrolase [Haloarcula pelagica]|uniref:alpha/beta hydrolase n=1 Tax=Haloarcula pelagica TaxID=3033389 RepID=UPI0024C2B264|nr:dienelactone hydrolase family protein [Halomicroarcula sp. YJ-61-S]